jgi:methyltransferase (TIGR00027 family)
LSRVQSSKTALAVAALRAYHHLADPEPKLLDDPIAHRLVDATLNERMEHEPARLGEPLYGDLRLHVLLRSRYAEDELGAAVARGVRQFVSLGAGFDTFAYRQPAWAHAIAIYEADQPATQAEKRRRLAMAEIPIPGNVRYAAIDFERTPLREGLRASGLDESRAVFFAWLGVMPYLSAAAVDATFAYVAALPQGSSIVFDFATARTPLAVAEIARDAGEPWLTRYDAAALERTLQGLGFAEVVFLTPEHAWQRYPIDATVFRMPDFTSIGKATV